MSGGSYNYLCHKEVDELLHAEEDIESMSARLAGLGYASDAAAETESLLLIVRQVRNRIEARTRRLHGVWLAVEWWDSGDWGEESLKRELEAYRKDGAP